MSEMSKELIAQDAYVFAHSNFGKWYLDLLKERAKALLVLSKDSTLPHERRVSALDHLVGIDEAIEAIESRSGDHDPKGPPVMR